MGYRVAVDTGGTFTDLLVYDSSTKAISALKVSSTPAEPDQAVMAAVQRIGPARDEIGFFGHSSTVALNTLLQRHGARTGLITTQGFSDILEIGRFNRPKMYDLFYTKPPPLVPRDLRLGVCEQIAADGSVLTPLDEKALMAAASQLVAIGVSAIAICFLNAYQNPEHEARAAELILSHYADLYVAASHEFVREWREFERTSTTVLNAYLSPSCQQYLQRLDMNLREQGFEQHVLITGSDGGLMSTAVAVRAPAATLMSGPAAGVQGAANIGQTCGFSNLITIDVGGTSCDVSLIQNGEPTVTHEKYIEGYPIIGTFVDVHSIGAGGGTIAWCDAVGNLKVGPQSAGADPGPVCYGLGGEKPTVTDAYLVLGFLDPNRFLGGEIRLQAEGAWASITTLARKVDMSAEQCAFGIFCILNAQMTGALRVASIEKGYDPRDFALFAFGGAGGIHAAALACEMSMRRAIVPTMPAHLSPWGILTAELRLTHARTEPRIVSELDSDWLLQRIAELCENNHSTLTAEGVEPENLNDHVFLDLRYLGQDHTLRLPFSIHPSAPTMESVVQRFHQAYQAHSGYHLPNDSVELVTVRVGVTVRSDPPRLSRLPETGFGKALHETRRVWLDEFGYKKVRVYRRSLLAPGEILGGPAIIEELASATLVHPGQTVRVDSFGNLVIHLDAE